METRINLIVIKLRNWWEWGKECDQGAHEMRTFGGAIAMGHPFIPSRLPLSPSIQAPAVLRSNHVRSPVLGRPYGWQKRPEESTVLETNWRICHGCRAAGQEGMRGTHPSYAPLRHDNVDWAHMPALAMSFVLYPQQPVSLLM